MANEPIKKTVAAPDTGAKTAKSHPLDVVAATLAAKPVAPPAPVAAPAAQSVPLFGGHRGGGKKRLDGLPAGSPAAIAADKAKDRERKNAANALKKVATLPPPLPSAPGATENAAAPVGAGDVAVSAAPAGAVPVAGAAPLFVPWGQKLLEKPAKLIGKIVERWRGYSRSAQVKKLKLTPAVEKEVLARMQWREDVVNDFSIALADCATVELNKRRVPGAENSHWINLVMSAGELVSLELANSALIEKLILEDKAKQAEAEKGTQ